MSEVVKLADVTGQANHWTPEEALAFAVETLKEHGASTLIVGFYDPDGMLHVTRAGQMGNLVALTARMAQVELAEFQP